MYGRRCFHRPIKARLERHYLFRQHFLALIQRPVNNPAANQYPSFIHVHPRPAPGGRGLYILPSFPSRSPCALMGIDTPCEPSHDGSIWRRLYRIVNIGWIPPSPFRTFVSRFPLPGLQLHSLHPIRHAGRAGQPHGVPLLKTCRCRILASGVVAYPPSGVLDRHVAWFPRFHISYCHDSSFPHLMHL